MAIAVNLALGLVHLPVMQSFQDLREEPVASFGSVAQLRGNAMGATGKALLGEVAKVST